MTIRKRKTRPEYRLGVLAEKTVSMLEAQGLKLPGKPSSQMPELPSDATDLGDAELMSLYSEFVAWGEYAESQSAAAAVDEKEAERRLASAIAREIARGLDEGKKITEARADAKAVTGAYEEEVLSAEAYRKVVESVSSACDKSASLLSRELSRRLSSPDTSRRASQRFAP